MVPSGRKHSGKSVKSPMGSQDQRVKTYYFQKEPKPPVLEKHGKKRPEGIIEDMGGEVQNMLEKFGADINKALLAKRKRLEMYTKASLKNSFQKIEQVWKIQREQRETLCQEYSQEFTTVFQQWDTDMQKTEEQGEKLINTVEQQQKFFQQTRVIQSQRLKTIRQLFEQFMKGMEDLEKHNDTLLAGTQNELKKEMSLLQKKIMMETQQQEMANVRKSLQSMLF